MSAETHSYSAWSSLSNPWFIPETKDVTRSSQYGFLPPWSSIFDNSESLCKHGHVAWRLPPVSDSLHCLTVSLLGRLQHQVAVKNPHGASMWNVCQETAARQKQGQCCADLITHFKPSRRPTSSMLADGNGAIAAWTHTDGPHRDGHRHRDRRSCWPH